MLLSLAQWLQSLNPEFGFFRVFQYLTLRAVMAALTALLMGLLAGPYVIRRLTELKIGQPIRGYGMDSHNCSRFVTMEDGKARVLNEGDVQAHGFPPYAIPYRALTPNPRECTNLLVPVCVSASHIAFGSARMEPVFMVLGQSAATAACQAIDEGKTVQEIRFEKLRSKLLEGGQVLEAPK